MRQQLERQEQAAIVKLLKLLGASVWVLGTVRPKGDTPGTGNTAGVPDIYCVMPPMVGRPYPFRSQPVWIEVKSKHGRLSPEQRSFRDAHKQVVGLPHLVGGIDVVTDWLRQGGWIK